MRGCRRCLTQTRVDVVLLAAAIPRRGHLGSDPTNAVVPGKEPFARCRHRLVPLRVTHALALYGLAHGGTKIVLAPAAARVKGSPWTRAGGQIIFQGRR